MSTILDKPVTWRSVIGIGLVWAAEYALLALIEDAPEALKVATVVCALAALFILTTENWFHRQHRHLFIISILVVTTIYMGFVAYAAVHVIGRQERQAKLREFYVSGSLFPYRGLPVHQGDNGENYEPQDVKRLGDDVGAWRNETKEWLTRNFGRAASVRFSEVGNIPDLCWGPRYEDRMCDFHYGNIMNRLTNDLRNLSSILETTAYND